MSFFAPERLWLLVGVAVLAIAYVLLQGRRSRYAVRFTSMELLDVVAPNRPGWRRHLPAISFLLALATLVVAYAQPNIEDQVPRERATVVMALDVSLSMEADDVDPNRFEAAKAAATNFVGLIPEKINLGLVVFDGVARVQVAPTTDRQLMVDAIQRLELGESTAIGEAIFASLDAIASVPPDDEGTIPPARVVLMSDGVTQQGRPNEDAAEEARTRGIPVSTISFGTPFGQIVYEEPGQAPQLVDVPVDQEQLRAIADATSGTFFTAESAGELEQVYTDIGSSVGFVTTDREITDWFVAGALALLALTAALSLAFFSRLP
jgi:Ca-activated chloride channel family protein